MPDRVSTVALWKSDGATERIPLPPWLMPALLAAAVAGGAGFLALAFGDEPRRAWRIFLVNFLFWNGAAGGLVAVAAIFEVSRARWPGPLRGLAEACATFLVGSVGLFAVLCLGRQVLFTPSVTPHGDTAWWRDPSFLLLREAVALLLFATLAVYFSAKAREKRQESGGPAASAAAHRIALALVFLFVIVYTLQAWDFVMALDPAWSSTVLGGFYFVSNLYLAFAFLTLLTIAAARRSWIDGPLAPELFANLGKLLLTFAMLWAYLVWSQYLVVWYGNLPGDREFMLLRTARSPWNSVAIAALLMNALLPFVILLSRTAKRSPGVLLGVSLLIVTGIWLERFLLVVPSLASDTTSLFGWQETLITAGFFALFAASWLWTAKRQRLS
jgi:hypothetical protein